MSLRFAQLTCGCRGKSITLCNCFMKVEVTLCFISGHVASVTIGYMGQPNPHPAAAPAAGQGHRMTRVKACHPRRARSAHRGVRGSSPREIWLARAPDTMLLFAIGRVSQPIGRVSEPQPLYWLLDAWPVRRPLCVRPVQRYLLGPAGPFPAGGCPTHVPNFVGEEHSRGCQDQIEAPG